MKYTTQIISAIVIVVLVALFIIFLPYVWFNATTHIDIGIVVPGNIIDGSNSCNFQSPIDRMSGVQMGLEDYLLAECGFLSSEDINIIVGLVGSGNTDNRVMIRQSSQEYESFLRKIERIKKNPCNCDEIISMEREADWTYYYDSSKNGCGAVKEPPFYCPNNSHFIPLLLIFSIPFIIIGIIVWDVKLLR